MSASLGFPHADCLVSAFDRHTFSVSGAGLKKFEELSDRSERVPQATAILFYC